ncbi:hypothetical protein A4X13_0g3178 [Tilletia indica]|uniref:Reverse transcriptase n=1 Tax=Tilletia indica TaxID=43049 RepID=A0A177TYC7_9BASI|nr:hypothetical protein A4X13_0g3178 [Tilletia indica]
MRRESKHADWTPPARDAKRQAVSATTDTRSTRATTSSPRLDPIPPAGLREDDNASASSRGTKRYEPGDGEGDNTVRFLSAGSPTSAAVRARAEDATSDSQPSELSFRQVERLLEISSSRAQDSMREALADSDARHREMVDSAERRHMEQLELLKSQHAEQLRNLQTRPAAFPTTEAEVLPREQPTPSRSRGARTSLAAHAFLGAESATVPPHARVPPHMLPPRTPFLNPLETPGVDVPRNDPVFPTDLRPRRFERAKPSEIGIFNPNEGKDIFSWWKGLTQFMRFAKATEAEIFAGLPGCFEGWAKEWFMELDPAPVTLKDFRQRAFETFIREEGAVSDHLEARKFLPDQETLQVYLTDKYRLVSELQVARAVAIGDMDFDNPKPQAAMVLFTVKDAIRAAHNGLPANWQVLLDRFKDEVNADWSAYRSKLIRKERQTREAIGLLTRTSLPSARNDPPRTDPRASTPAHAPPAAVRTATDTSRSDPPRQQPRVYRDDAARKRDRELGLCFECHEPGHSKFDCPRLKAMTRNVRSILVKLETENDPDEHESLMQQLRAATVSARPLPQPEEDDSDSDEDDVARVRFARAIQTSIDDDPAPVRERETRVRAVRMLAEATSRRTEAPGQRHRVVVAHKVAVTLTADDTMFELHVDGGSPLSMITERALRTVSPDASILPAEPLKIRGYRGDDFQKPKGVVVLDVTFPTANGKESVKSKFEFHVVDECTGGWILGVDNMKADGIDALSKKERLVFESRPDAEVRLLQTREGQRRVESPTRLVCAKTTIVAAHTVRLVEIDAVDSDRIVHPWWFSHEEAPTGFVQVPSSIIGPQTRAIEVINTSDVDVQLEEGDVLGETEAVGKEVCSLDELESLLRKGKLSSKRSNRQTASSLRAWMKGRRNDGRKSADVRAKRVLLTQVEPDGADVLPEIDFHEPSSTQQTVRCSSKLTSGQKERLLRVLKAHAVWPTPKRPLGLYEYGPVSLRLRPGQEHWSHAEPPRRTSPAQQEVIDETLREHDVLDVSEPSQGPYASGVVLVQQRDKIRFCNDYRPLNKVTIDDFYAMPTVDVIYDQLGKARFFTVLDANKGYYQFWMDEASRDLTGFVTFRGLRRYKRMPFGLKQAPSWFQRAMDRVLGVARWKFALAYLDDIVVYSLTFADHLAHVDVVLAALERAGLTVSPSKCRFAYESVSLLGYRVSSMGLMTDKEKTRAVTDFPEPTTAVEARRFFAMAAWYRRFVHDFAGRGRAINKSFVGDTFVWGEEERTSFEDLRLAISSAPVLKRPEFGKPFILAVDASKQGLGGVLLQCDENGLERPILFISRQTTDGERKYAPTHLELASVWWCVKKLHHYIDGSSVEVRTDHNALRWLWDLKPSEMTEVRVQKFKMALAPLEGKITVTYTKGKDNVVADALSRAPVVDLDGTEEDVELIFDAREYERVPSELLADDADVAVRSVSRWRLGDDELSSWAAAYATDSQWRRIWKKAEQREPVTPDIDQGPSQTADVPQPTPELPTSPTDRQLRPRRVLAVHRSDDDALFFRKDGLLFVRNADRVKLCVPDSKLDALIHEYHTSMRAGHPSAERTVNMMKDHLFAHDLAQRVALHVKRCYECQVNKPRRHQPHGDMQAIVVLHEIFRTLAMDFVTGLPKTLTGFDAIQVVSCKYSRWVWFIPGLMTDTAEQVAVRFFERVVPMTGVPESIISDRDARFTSAFWSHLMAQLDVKLRMSTAYHPQTDGLVERLNAQLEIMLRHYVALDQHDWDAKLPALSLAYNNQRQESTGESPYKLVFGRDPSVFPLRTLTASANPSQGRIADLFALHADAQAAIELAQERQRQQYNRSHKAVEFAVGDPVLIDLKNYRFNVDPTAQARVKLGPRYAGPFKVTERVGRLAYRLDVPSWFKAHPVLPVSALEPFIGDADKVAPRPQSGIAADGARDELRVLAFLGRRPTSFVGNQTFDYLVKWAGPPPTWQSEDNLPGLSWARQTFETRARNELGLRQLRKKERIILAEGMERALELEQVAEGVDLASLARTQGSLLGGDVVT